MSNSPKKAVYNMFKGVKAKFSWVVIVIILSILSLGMLLACQFLLFSDPESSYPEFGIWNNGCLSSGELDECMLIKSTSILAIFFLALTIIIGSLYWFKKGIILGILTIVSIFAYMAFQITTTVYINDQIGDRPRKMKSTIAWKLMVSAMVISFAGIVLNPVILTLFGGLASELLDFLKAISSSNNKVTQHAVMPLPVNYAKII